jgi:hypothetical protein
MSAATIAEPAVDAPEKTHIVTVQFAIVLDEGDTIEHELADLGRAIGILYGDYGEQGEGPGQHPDPTFYTPQGEWQIVDLSPPLDYCDLARPSQIVLDTLPQQVAA